MYPKYLGNGIGHVLNSSPQILVNALSIEYIVNKWFEIVSFVVNLFLRNFVVNAYAFRAYISLEL